MQIGDRKIGSKYPPLVIAEIGINHEGNLDIAKKLVDAAASAGAEVIKHQTHVVEDEMSSAAKAIIPGNATESIFSIMERCALNEADEFELMRYVEAKGLIFISTPFSRAAADRLERMGVPAFKIGSGECNNLPLVSHVANFGKPMIVSTGMNDLDSVRKTKAVLDSKGVQYAFLHTTNLYPTPSNLVRLGAMQKMMEAFPGVEVGLSDHTTSNLACYAAVALGANILERHFTDSMSRNGPDIVNSMDPSALSALIEGSAAISLMRGGEKEAADEEQITIDFAFATVVTTKPIHSGELFTSENIWVKRPGSGEIAAEFYDNLLGKIASRDIAQDTHLEWGDVCD